MIENIIVDSEFIKPEDKDIIFGDEDVLHVKEGTDLSVLMKDLGIFKSTSEARRAGRVGNIPTGYTDNYKASKKRRLYIWNPTE